MSKGAKEWCPASVAPIRTTMSTAIRAGAFMRRLSLRFERLHFWRVLNELNTPPAWDGRPQDLSASSDCPGARDESAGRPLRALTAPASGPRETHLSRSNP